MPFLYLGSHRLRPTRNHWVLKEENSLFWHTVVLNWINKFSGLPAYKDEREQGYIVQN